MADSSMLPTLTIDIGTTNVKTSLFDEHGDVVEATALPTPVTSDAWGEIYDVAALEQQFKTFLGALSAPQRERIRRVTVGGVGESGALVAPDCTLASPIILWYDRRGAPWIDRLSARQRERIYAISGLPANANYGLSKAAWAVARLRRTGRRCDGAVWLNVSEYLAARLTGVRRAEYSLASRTLALDLARRAWSAEVCAMFDLSVAVLPPLCAARDGLPLTPAAMRATGLSADTRVHIAGHDHMVGAVAAALRPGELLDSTGTTEGLLRLVDAPRLDAAALRTGIAGGVSVTGDNYTAFGSIPTGGSAFATLQALLAMEASELRSRQEALLTRYRAGDLDLARVPLVLPRFRGAPLPTKDPAARGVVAGIGTDTSADELIFGTFLGMAWQCRDVVSLFDYVPERVKVIGPAARDPLWLQLKADVLNVPHTAARAGELVSHGAQALACGATPAWEDWNPKTTLPDPDRVRRLRAWLQEAAPRWQHLKEIPS